MSQVHKIKHHVHHHKEKVKYHVHHHKEKIKYHVHHHKERIKHQVHRHKQSLPEVIFNKHLVLIFIITLSIPITVLLVSQQQNLQKKAAENKEPNSKGYIVEFNNNSMAMERRSSSLSSVQMKERRINIENQHKVAKQKVLEILESNGNSTPSGVAEISNSKIKGEYQNVINGVALDISSAEAEKIKKSPYVKGVYPNYEVKTALAESVPLIGADRVWTQVHDPQNSLVTGKGVNIAIIDTGVDYRHSDLGGSNTGQIFNSKVTGGQDFINNDNDPMDDNKHGTHVAAIAAGNGVLKGVAPGANIIAYKVLDANGSGSFATIIAGIDAAIATHYDDDPSNDVSVINLSVGAYCGSTYSSNCGPDDVLSRAIDTATSEGIVSVVAAGNFGNYGSGTINTPGTARSALTVGSINKEKIISSFSSRGPVTTADSILQKPDVVAPGENICSARFSGYSGQNCLDGNHVFLSGTSMATPHVSGMAALVKQKNPTFSSSDIKYVIVQGTTSLGYDANTQGKGMIDALKIFSFDPILTPTPYLTPTVVPTSTLTPFPTPSLTPTPTLTPIPALKKLTLNPSADAFVRSSTPTTNFGTQAVLNTDTSPGEISYLKFNLASFANKKITKATLKIKVKDSSAATQTLKRGVSTNWSETGINYNNRPSFEATISTFNAKPVNGILQLNLTNAVDLRKGGNLTVGITSGGNDKGIFYSRESVNSNMPQLIIEYQ